MEASVTDFGIETGPADAEDEASGHLIKGVATTTGSVDVPGKAAERLLLLMLPDEEIVGIKLVLDVPGLESNVLLLAIIS